MPNHTVSTNVDTMLRAADNAAIRTAIGLGTTDGPTFLNSTVVGLTSIFRAGTGTGFSSEFGSGGLALHSASQIAWASSFSGFGAKDLALERDAAGILSQRNGTNAQAFRVYNTTDGTNKEYGEISWIGNFMYVRPAATGTGVIRGSLFGTVDSSTYIDGANVTFRGAGNTQRWTINSSGHFYASTDNLYDIGVSGGSRPRNVYVAGNIIPNGALAFSSQGQITAPAGAVYITSSGENMSGASNYIKSSNSNPFIIGTNNTERFTITSAGNAGIGDVTATGTRSPSAPFEVIKSTAVNGPMLVLRGDISGAGKWSSIAWGDQTQTNAFRKGAIIYESIHASVRGKLHISLNNTDGADSAGLSDARLTIAADGAVGVGASSPVNRLDIAETWNTIINVTGASGSGTIANITFATQTQAVPIGSTIVVAGINPAGYNGTFVVIASSTTALTYANATTATYVSGGTIERIFTSVKLNVTDTASNAVSKLMDLQVGGVSKFSVQKSGVVSFTGDVFGNYFYSGGSPTAGLFPNTVFVGNAGQIGFASGATFGGTFDTLLRQDAAGILSQRNGVLAQAFRAYNTFTDTNNKEWGEFDWKTTANTLRIGTNHFGSGVARPIDFVTGGVVRMTIQSGGNISIPNGLFVTGNITAGYLLKLTALTVATLPSAASNAFPTLVGVSDATTTAALGKGTTVVGGGSNKVIVMSDGTNWVIL